MYRIDRSRPESAPPSTDTEAASTSGLADDLVEASLMGVFGYDVRDGLGSGEVRVLIAARGPGHAARRIRRAGIRVHRWTPPLTLLPRHEAEMARSAPGVVMWRSHDREVVDRWFRLP